MRPLRLGFGNDPQVSSQEKPLQPRVEFKAGSAVASIEIVDGGKSGLILVLTLPDSGPLTFGLGQLDVPQLYSEFAIFGTNVLCSGGTVLAGSVKLGSTSTAKGNQTGNATFSLNDRPFQSVVLTGTAATREYALLVQSIKGYMTISAHNNSGAARTVNFRNASDSGTVLHTLSLASNTTIVAHFVCNGAAWVFTGAQTYAGSVIG